MTNYEKIKAMSVDEMADAMANALDCAGCPTVSECREHAMIRNCKIKMKKWLLQEAEE